MIKEGVQDLPEQAWISPLSQLLELAMLSFSQISWGYRYLVHLASFLSLRLPNIYHHISLLAQISMGHYTMGA